MRLHVFLFMVSKRICVCAQNGYSPFVVEEVDPTFVVGVIHDEAFWLGYYKETMQKWMAFPIMIMFLLRQRPPEQNSFLLHYSKLLDPNSKDTFFRFSVSTPSI